MRSRILAIVVAVVVPLAALGVVMSRGGGGSPRQPARLPILASGSSGGRSAALGVAQDAMLAPYGGVVYKADPNLPKLEGSARAYKVNLDGAAEQLRRLTDILVGQDQASSDHSAMMVGAPDSPQWSFNRQSDGVVTSSGSAVACPANAECLVPPTTVPQHPANLPSEDEARKIALELLQQAGIDVTNAIVSVDDYITVWSVQVDPKVDGLATQGFGSTVAIGPDGVVEYANGILGRPEAADEYPLIGTTAAIDRLNKGEGFIGPRPMMAEAGSPSGSRTASGGASDGGAPGSVGATEPGSVGPAEPTPVPCDATGAPTTLACGYPVQVDPPVIDTIPPDSAPPVTDTIPPPPPPQEITFTGAEQILMYAPSYTGNESWLVPGYRFTTAEPDSGSSVLAIDDTFLTPPDQLPTGKGSIDPGGTVTIEPQPAPESDPAVKEPSTGG